LQNQYCIGFKPMAVVAGQIVD